MRSFVSVLVLLALSVLPLAARAQTLTIEVEASVSAPSPPADREVVIVVPGPVVREEADPLPAVPRPVVIVAPLEADERDPRSPPRSMVPRWADPPPAVSLPVAPLPGPAAEDDEGASDGDEIEGYAAFGLWAEQIDLSRLDLQLRSPEIEALAGTQLPADWAGNAPLRETIAGGASVAIGMRAARYLRGPELRVLFGGSDGEGPWAPSPGGPDGLALAVRGSFMIRFEAALGLQLPLGPVTPYVLGRAGAGAAWIDVAVSDPRLGNLGTETVETSMLELGIEAGIEIRPNDDGLVVGAAFRGSFLGTPSLGGMLTVGYAGE